MQISERKKTKVTHNPTTQENCCQRFEVDVGLKDAHTEADVWLTVGTVGPNLLLSNEALIKLFGYFTSQVLYL